MLNVFLNIPKSFLLKLISINRLLLSIFLLGQQFIIVAQIEETQFTKVNFYPPVAASLMKYVEFPVSTLTGIPDIRIPLYEINSGDVQIPVQLRST